ncbi:LuxR C-terminal-related transcriptional regulator [Secundilactobacillus collinoides]|uniref:Response regulator n=2 Tax=Secundilactobacillus collinoides TaxID=33960 RepID=A0A0R2BF43_SECCO|nr:response regulator transcription factor [Secundilactobacillus collinoides]KRM77751.1 response regulator [Secundilactobacillus collinoides DSM 20515 = JCM 1123]KZL38926.1 hypothetical protein TY91_11505 [Secundilactobacillus collinoides]
MHRVLIATDCAITNAGITAIINQIPGFNVIGQVTNGSDAVTRVANGAINLAVIDLSMRGENALFVLEKLHRRFPKVGILAMDTVSMFNQPAEAIRKGALAYLLMNSPIKEFGRAISAVSQGKLYLDTNLLMNKSEVAQLNHCHEPSQTCGYDTLSDREREVLPLVILGYSNKQIGQRLFISVKTVESHKANIMRKLAVDCHCDLIKYAMQHHLVTF